MQTIILIFLITANSLTSIIVIALGSSLFIFPNSEVSLELQSFNGIYIVFALLCFCEPVKWLRLKNIIDFKHHKTIRFLITYGVILMTTFIIYQLYFFSLIGLPYIICYFILRKIPPESNMIIEKEVPGQALKSDSLFLPLPKKPKHDRDVKK